MEVIPGSINEENIEPTSIKLEDVAKIKSFNDKNKKVKEAPTEVIQNKEKINNYYFEFNVTLEDKKVMLVSYIVQDKSKQLAEAIAREKLKDKYLNIKTVKLKTSRKKCFKDIEKNELIKILPNDYEVTFRININGIKYDKCFIISSNDESNINSLLEKRCKKEFKNYRSLTSINYKLADDNSKEYSKEVKEEFVTVNKINDIKTKKTSNVIKPNLSGKLNPITGNISLDDQLKISSMSKKQIRKEISKAHKILDDLENKNCGSFLRIHKDNFNGVVEYTDIIDSIREIKKDEVSKTCKKEDYIIEYNDKDQIIGVKPQITILDKDYYKYHEYYCIWVYDNNETSRMLSIIAKDIRDAAAFAMLLSIDGFELEENLTFNYMSKHVVDCIIRNTDSNMVDVYEMKDIVSAVTLYKANKENKKLKVK